MSRTVYINRVGLAMLVATLAASACWSPPGPQLIIQTDRGPIAISVELARSRDEISRGLMWRDHLDDDAGMLFIFPAAAPRTFWMKNTPLPLDIVFIGADAKIVSIAADTTPYSHSPIPSAGAAMYVLEVNGGFAAVHGIRPGMSVKLPERRSALETRAE